MKPFGALRQGTGTEEKKSSKAKKKPTKSAKASRMTTRSRTRASKAGRRQLQPSQLLTEEEKMIINKLKDWKQPSEMAYDSLTNHCKTLNISVDEYINKALIKEIAKMDESSMNFGLQVEQ